ncbi:hypothetical protein AAC387_Pa03g0726 [Persea americana]
MGLFSYCLGGGSLVLIGAWETISAAYTHLNPTSSTPPPNTTTTTTTPTSTARTRRRRTSSAKAFSTITSIAVAFLSFLTIIDSSISSLNASRYHDRVGAALQLPTIAVSSLFLLYALAALLSNLTHFLPLPPSILNLIALFGFGQEFLLFYLQRKDPDGIENRYFDLLLVPISICVVSTLVELGYPRSQFPRLGRGVGLILQGTWFVQMGLSFYTGLIAHGCDLIEKSRGNYTVRCKHMDEHRSKAIATLQFNCHLALLVVVVVGLYSFMGWNYGSEVNYSNYKPLGEELRSIDDNSHFTLDSDEEDEEITVAKEVNSKQSTVLPVNGLNGFGTH